MKSVDYYADLLRFYARHPGLYRWRKHEFDHHKFLAYQTSWLQQLGIRTILDIGANVGQAALVFRLAFPQARIHSFEPLPDCFDRLDGLARRLGNITPYPVALGTETGTVRFERNSYSASSSLLTMNQTHREHFPFAAATVPVEVALRPLDEVLADVPLETPLLIKLDVQGYEKQVIEGGRQTIARAKVVISETSMEPLYDGQPLFRDMAETFHDLGFRYAGSFDQLISPKDGRILQQDAIFVR